MKKDDASDCDARCTMFSSWLIHEKFLVFFCNAISFSILNILHSLGPITRQSIYRHSTLKKAFVIVFLKCNQKRQISSKTLMLPYLSSSHSGRVLGVLLVTEGSPLSPHIYHPETTTDCTRYISQNTLIDLINMCYKFFSL